MHRLLVLAGLTLLASGCVSTTSTASNVASLSDADWTTSAQGFQDQPGLRIQLVCPPNPNRENVGTVWGAEVYTDDSAICPAAVHAGKIPFDRGGSVTIEIRPGQASYRGTDWNGVVSQPYGEWGGSFVVR